MSVSEQIVSRTLLRSFLPLSRLSDDQLELILENSKVVNLYKGQTLVKAGDGTQKHLYLIHGTLIVAHISGDDETIEAGASNSYKPIAHVFPRRSSVFADSDCTVLEVNSEFLEKLMCWGQVARCLLAEVAADENYLEDYFWIKKLLESKLFYKVPPTNIRSVLNNFTEMEVSSGDKIIQYGDEGTCCYLIKYGKAEVRVKAMNNDVVAELGPGVVFGEDALVTNNPRNASVIMSSDGLLMKLEKKDFYQLLTQPTVTMVTPGNIDGFLNTGAKLLDVRTEEEFGMGHHAKSINMPLNLVYLKSRMLDKSGVYITYSASEERARAAAYLLAEQGFTAYALQSGMNGLPRDMSEQFMSGI